MARIAVREESGGRNTGNPAMRLPTIALAIVLVPLAAQARPTKPSEEFVAATEEAATDCLSEAILANPGAMAKARAGLWYEAAGVMGFICRPEVDTMMRTRDAVGGPGAGQRFFRKVYARKLGKLLAARLGPNLTQAVAHAEPRDE